MDSVVYFVERKSDGAIKIGTSIRLRARLKAHAARHGDMELLGVMPGSYYEEKKIQKFFECFRIGKNYNDEYFIPASSIKRFVHKNATLDGMKNTKINRPMKRHEPTDHSIEKYIELNKVTIKMLDEDGDTELAGRFREIVKRLHKMKYQEAARKARSLVQEVKQ